MSGFLLALEFLTIARFRPFRPEDTRTLARSQAYFPAIGLLLGLGLAGADRLLAPLLPALLLNAVLVVLLIVVTGGLHLDGLGDTADGVFGGHGPEERLAIMKDPRLGSYGMLAIASLLLLKWAALASLTSPWRIAGLLVAPTLARWSVVAAIAAVPYGRQGGLWVEFHRQAWPAPVVVAGGTALVVALVAFGIGGLALLGAGTVVALGMVVWFKRLLGGLTGDTYGAVLEVTETLVLILVTSAHGGPWLRPWPLG